MDKAACLVTRGDTVCAIGVTPPLLPRQPSLSCMTSLPVLLLQSDTGGEYMPCCGTNCVSPLPRQSFVRIFCRVEECPTATDTPSDNPRTANPLKRAAWFTC